MVDMASDTVSKYPDVLVVDLTDFALASLAPSVKKRWEQWRSQMEVLPQHERLDALREAARAGRGHTASQSHLTRAVNEFKDAPLQARASPSRGSPFAQGQAQRSPFAQTPVHQMNMLARTHPKTFSTPDRRAKKAHVQPPHDGFHPLPPPAVHLRRHHTSKRIQRSWRTFAKQRGTTAHLARCFADCGLFLGGSVAPAGAGDAAPSVAAQQEQEQEQGQAPVPSLVMVGGVVGLNASGAGDARHLRFEELAQRLQAPATLQATQALLTRLEHRLLTTHGIGGGAAPSAQPVLRRLSKRPLGRYPERVFLAAYMMCTHPEVVFSSLGEVEARLSAAAAAMLTAFEALLPKLLPAAGGTHALALGPAAAASPAAPSSTAGALAPLLRAASSSAGDVATMRPRRLLVRWDELWLAYLDLFVVWKTADAGSLVTELAGMAARLEASKLRTVRRGAAGAARLQRSEDLRMVEAEVAHDHALLRERVRRLAGVEGVAALDAALEAARQQAEEEEEWESTSEWSSRRTSRANSGALPDAINATALSSSLPPPSTPEPSAPPGREIEGSTNEQIVWEMLYDSHYSFPTEEAEATWRRALAAAGAAPGEAAVGEGEAAQRGGELEGMDPAELAALVAQRARVVVERAYWDSVEWRLHTAMQADALTPQVAPLLSELGKDLSLLVPEDLEAQQLASLYAPDKVASRLSSRLGSQMCGANAAALTSMLQQLGRAAGALTAPARALAAAAAGARVEGALAAALATQGAGAGAGETASVLAPALMAALRLLTVQTQLVKLDAANARLAALAAAMRGNGAVAYLRTKLAAEWQLGVVGPADGEGDAAAEQGAPTADALRTQLPKTAAWLLATSTDALPALQQRLAAAGLGGDGAAGSGIDAALLPAMRAGVARGGAARPSNTDAGSAGSVAGAPQVQPVHPVDAASWRGRVRIGLVALVSGAQPAAGTQLPEVLRYDAVRLHQAQDALQMLMAQAAGLLLVQQLRAAAAPQPQQQQGGRAAWARDAQAAAARRLRVVLSDPEMRLPDVVTELTELVGGAASEAAVKAMYLRLLDPQGPALKSIGSALSAVLAAHVLRGRSALAPGSTAGRAAAAALARVGAGVLAEDVAALGQRLALVAAVNEAVHAPVLQRLADA